MQKAIRVVQNASVHVGAQLQLSWFVTFEYKHAPPFWHGFGIVDGHPTFGTEVVVVGAVRVVVVVVVATGVVVVGIPAGANWQKAPVYPVGQKHWIRFVPVTTHLPP